MLCIYCMTNKINGKKYIGQTNNFRRRMTQHKNDSQNPNAREYSTAIGAAIRKYGWENFENKIIFEANDDEKDLINEKEIYYIEYYNTFHGDGYNSAPGGQYGFDNRIYESKVRDNNLLDSIIDDLKNGISHKEIALKYNISIPYVSDINNGNKLRKEGETYPLQKSQHRKNEEIYDNIVYELKNTRTSMRAIAEKYGIHKDTVSRINLGKMDWVKEKYPEEIFPLRKDSKKIPRPKQ